MHTSPCPASLCMYRLSDISVCVCTVGVISLPTYLLYDISLCMHRLSDISVCAYRLSDICGLGAFPQRAQRWSWVSFGVVWVGGLVYVPWCGGLVGGLSIGLWVHVTMEEDCPGAPKTIPRWTPEGTEVLGVIWCCLWVLELVCVCLGLGVGGWLGHRFLGACGRGGGLPRSTENDPKIGPRAFEKCRKMITKALILGSWAPRRRGLGTYLGRLGPQVERSWNLGPQVDQNSPKNDFITPPPWRSRFRPKIDKVGYKGARGRQK